MSNRVGPPKHQNRYAWKPNAGKKINEKEIGGKLRPYAEITGVCFRCKEQIEWKRRYGKYKPLIEPAKCVQCSKRAVRQAYHSLCSDCAKERNVCAKCCCHRNNIIQRQAVKIENGQKMRGANGKFKSKISAATFANDAKKVGHIFPGTSLEDYSAKSKSINKPLSHQDDVLNEYNCAELADNEH